ncbi:hypothetical protein DFAR_2210090 [Desulfarculales bacterium]
MGADPVGQTMGLRGFDKSVAASAQNRHEDLGPPNLTRQGDCHVHGLAGIIDNRLLASPVLMAHDQPQLA